jgi:hypothetical protein
VTEIIKETTVKEGNTINPVVNTSTRSVAVKSTATSSQTMEYLIYFIFGLLEVLLVFRLVFKLAGANPISPFVKIIYSITSIFIMPFEGIFRRGFAEGVETTSVLEPSTLVAIVVYALLAWGVVLLVRILSRQKQPTD